MNLPITYDVDVSAPLLPVPLEQMLISGDKNANRIDIRLFKSGAPYAPGGTCQGYALRSDGGTVAIVGTVIGNVYSVVLPQAAYAVQGSLVLTVRIADGGDITTVFCGVGSVNRTTSDTVIDPGTIIPDVTALLAAIEAAVATIPLDYSALSDDVKSLTRVELTESGYIDENGAEAADANYARTGFIPCDVHCAVSLVGAWTGTAAYAYTFYTAQQARISGASSVTADVSPAVPATAAYVRFSSRVSQGETPVAYVANHVVADMVALSRRAEDTQELAANAMQGIAPVFAPTEPYAAGEYVWYLGTLYRFTAAHAAGAWTGEDAEAAEIGDDVTALQTALQPAVTGEGLFMSGSINAGNGAYFDSATRIRYRGFFATGDYHSVYADSGYLLLIYAWNAATGAFVGVLQTDGTFANAATNMATVSAYTFTNAGYLYAVVCRYADGTEEMDVSDAAHVHFTLPVGGAFDHRLSALESGAVMEHTGKNLANVSDPSLILSGKYVEYSSGRVRNNTGYSSVLLPVLGGSVISTRGTANAHITFYTGKPPAFNSLAAAFPIPGYISGLTQAAVLTNYTTPADASWMIVSIGTSSLAALQVEYGAAATAYEPYKRGVDYSLILDPPEIPGQVETIEYAIKTDGSGDFANLRECLAAIPMTADPLKQYVVNLYPGTHDIIAMYDSESDMPTNGLYLPPNTKIRGIGDKHNVIISGVRTTTSTSWSVLNIVDYADVENLTITSKNARYTIHDDFQSAINARSTRHFRDVIFIGENCQYGSVYGSGMKGNADWEFINCEFHAEESAANGTPGNAFSLHNNNNVTRPSFVRFENCRLLNGSQSYKTLRLLSMTTGSANGGVYVTLEGNKIDGLHLGENNASQYGAGCSFWVNGFGNINPLGVTVSSTDGVDYTDRVDLI